MIRSKKDGQHSGVMPTSDAKFTKRLFQTVGVVLAVGLFVTLVWLSIQVWLTVFAGILLAVFLSALTRWFVRVTHLPRVWSLLVVLVVLLGLAALGGWLLAPKISHQFSELAQRLPKAIDQIRQKWASHQGWDRLLPRNVPPASDLAGNAAGKYASNIAGFFRLSLEAVTNFLVILFLGIYLAATPQMYVDGIVRLFPKSRRGRAAAVIEEIGLNLGNWLLGQLLSMAIVGTLISVGLILLGIPLGLALGVLAGLLNVIPIVGALFSACLAVLLAFFVSPWRPLYVVGLYLVVNGVIESHLLVPLIQRHAVKLPPAVAVVSLLLLTRLFGFFGLLLAIPLATTTFVLLKTVYLEDVLGDRRPTHLAAPERH